MDRKRKTGADDEVFDVGCPNIITDFEKALFPRFAFPAMRRIGIHAQRLVAVANLHERKKVIGRGSRGAGVNLVAKLDPELAGVVADLPRFLHETLLPFLEQIISRPRPKSPRIPGRQFPAESDAPKHRHDLDLQFGEEIQQAQDVLLRPRFDLVG